MIPLDTLNRCEPSRFVAVLGSIFEHSPWVAERVCALRPFATLSDLHQAMCRAVAEADPALQLDLICAHPQLAGKAAIRGELTAASQREQASAGLDQCSAEEFAQITELNARYYQQFGFPFVLAVRGHTRASIIANLGSRLSRSREQERAEALAQIERIAAFRLADLCGDNLPTPSP